MPLQLTKDRIIDLAVQSLNAKGDNPTIRANVEGFYDATYGMMLAERDWNFSRKKIYLANGVLPASENGLFGEWDFPSDHIRGGTASYVVGDNAANGTAIAYQARWSNKGGKILIYGWGDLLNYPTNIAAGTPVRVLFEYFAIPSEESIPPAFAFALSYKLALIVAPKWAPEMQPQIQSLFKQAYKTAFKQDGTLISAAQRTFRSPSTLLAPSFQRGADPTYFNYPGEPKQNF